MFNKTIGISIIKNEVDVIESFVRHNMQFFDELHIVDHHSTDNTSKILQCLKEEGLPIFIYTTPIIEHKQPKILTDLMRYCLQHDPSIHYVMALDADEFIACENKSVFLAHLARIPKNYVGLLLWQTYLPNRLNIDLNFLCHFDEIRQDNIIMSKVVFSRDIGLKGYFSPGNHAFNNIYTESYDKSCRYPGAVFFSQELQRFRQGLQQDHLLFIEDSQLRLAHYPVRSLPQLMSKTMVGALQMCRDNLLNADQDLYWQAVAYNFSEITHYTLEDLRKEAYLYRNDKVYHLNKDKISIQIEKIMPLHYSSIALKYSELIEINPLKNVFSAAMKLISSYANKQGSQC